jgi:N-carbamoylputrescine amidase
MRTVTVAATQKACTGDRAVDLDDAEALVREAAASGANCILLQELFAGHYFCQEESPAHFALAEEAEASATVARFAALARELGVVLPISYFERAGRAFFNSVAVADVDGTIRSNYRKSHIPDGPGYEEKYYFSPGDTGFVATETAVGTVGVGICWDQWFPEAARAMVLAGAEVLCYPTAIGSEPQDPTLDSAAHWRRTMQGHAAANMVPVVASNRVGTESFGNSSITFYGTSFIAEQTGAVVAELDRRATGTITHTFDLDALEEQRRAFGFFRDRRPDLYRPLLSLDGRRGPGRHRHR